MSAHLARALLPRAYANSPAQPRSTTDVIDRVLLAAAGVCSTAAVLLIIHACHWGL